MTAASWFEQALPLISSNVLLSRLVIATLEFSVLALVVVGLIRMFRPRSRRLVALAILVVLVRPVLGLIGFGTGTLTGILGAGGGFLIVPALWLGAGLSMPRAMGTSLLIIALNCAAGLLGFLGAVPIHCPSWIRRINSNIGTRIKRRRSLVNNRLLQL